VHVVVAVGLASEEVCRQVLTPRKEEVG